MASTATAIWRVRPGGSNINGGGYDPGIAGAGTDYSQQNAAQASGTVGTASGTTTFTDAGAAFTSAMRGNALFIASGAGFTTGAYWIITFNSSTSVVLDRSPGTGSAAQWRVGGAWADFWTNTDTGGNFGTLAANWIAPGNTIFILGSGTPNPASYTYDYTVTGFYTPVPGNATAGAITFANDPSTPGYKAPPDTTGGMPVIRPNGLLWFNVAYLNYNGLYIVMNGTSTAGYGVFGTYLSTVFGCVMDQFGNDYSLTTTDSVRASDRFNTILGCEIFSSVVPGSAGTHAAIQMIAGDIVRGCNIHDCVGLGVLMGDGTISDSIIAKCRSTGILVSALLSGSSSCLISSNIIDANLGSGISITNQVDIASSTIINNVISNHITGGTFGLTIGAGAAAANTRVARFVDYNSFYNNTTNYNAISAGAHDTALAVNPYVGQATENYTYA